MIHYLARRDHLYTIGEHLAGRGRGLRGYVVPQAYEELFATVADAAWWAALRASWWAYELPPAQAARLPAGHYIFSDYDRLEGFEATQAAALWQTLAPRPGTRVLNHPTRSMGRYELLRTLYERGINAFDVYRLTEARWPARYPVLVRTEAGHDGPKFPLLHSRAEVDAAVAQIEQAGQQRDDVLLVEFCDTADEQGLYRRYSAFYIDGQIFPKNAHVGKEWLVKGSTIEPEWMAESWAFIETNPHEEVIREVFQLARIDYGRIDYSFLDGRIQVWEINTNSWITNVRPSVPAEQQQMYELIAERFEKAVRAIR